MRWEDWVVDVAHRLGPDVEPEWVAGLYQVREMLYDSNASPGEAADFIRLNIGIG